MTAVFVPIDHSTLKWVPAHDGVYIMPLGPPEVHVSPTGRISYHQPVQHLYAHPTGPHWTYQHVPTEVQCTGCQYRFPHTALEEDWVEVGSDYEAGHLERICPHCKMADCCELEFEHAPPPPCPPSGQTPQQVPQAAPQAAAPETETPA